MPYHVHLLTRKHEHLAEDMIDALQRGRRERLVAVGLRGQDHPVWPQAGGKYSPTTRTKSGE
jgi:hypothetical protein